MVASGPRNYEWFKAHQLVLRKEYGEHTYLVCSEERVLFSSDSEESANLWNWENGSTQSGAIVVRADDDPMARV